MPTTPCPTCGLPRPADELDRSPCPVCAVADAPRPAGRATPEPAGPVLPADASQLAAHAPAEHPHHRPHLVTGVFAFAAGVVIAVAVQGAFFPHPEPPPAHAVETPAPLADPPPADPAPPVAVAPPSPPPARRVEVAVAPAPHEPAAADRPPAVAADAPAVVLEINQPEHSISFPTSYLFKPGQTAVLRGRVKGLTLYGMNGMTVDASGLVAERVYLGAPVAKGSVLKFHAPDGIVTVGATIGEGTELHIFAPNGEVNFTSNTLAVSGGKVTVTARKVEFRSPIEGDSTRVRVTLADGGVIKAAALRGKATLEYSKTNPDDAAPSIDVKQVDPQAVLRRAD